MKSRLLINDIYTLTRRLQRGVASDCYDSNWACSTTGIDLRMKQLTHMKHVGEENNDCSSSTRHHPIRYQSDKNEHNCANQFVCIGMSKLMRSISNEVGENPAWEKRSTPIRINAESLIESSLGREIVYTIDQKISIRWRWSGHIAIQFLWGSSLWKQHREWIKTFPRETTGSVFKVVLNDWIHRVAEAYNAQ